MKRQAVGFLVGSIVAGTLIHWGIDPVFYADTASKAIIKEYLAVYCVRPTFASDGDRLMYVAKAGLLSQLTIEAGLGPLSYTEYLKCRAEKGLK